MNRFSGSIKRMINDKLGIAPNYDRMSKDIAKSILGVHFMSNRDTRMCNKLVDGLINSFMSVLEDMGDKCPTELCYCLDGKMYTDLNRIELIMLEIQNPKGFFVRKCVDGVSIKEEWIVKTSEGNDSRLDVVYNLDLVKNSVLTPEDFSMGERLSKFKHYNVTPVSLISVRCPEELIKGEEVPRVFKGILDCISKS